MDFALTESQEELQGLARQILEDRMDLAAPEGARLLRGVVRPGHVGASSPRRTCSASRSRSRPAVSAWASSTSAWCCARSVAPSRRCPRSRRSSRPRLPIARFGTDAQQAVLPKIVSGDVLLTAALVELGAEPDRPATTATRDGDGWRIDGVKSNVPGAHVAEAVLVPAAARRRRRDAHRPDEHAGHHAHAPGDDEPRAAVRDAARRCARRRRRPARCTRTGARDPDVDAQPRDDRGVRGRLRRRRPGDAHHRAVHDRPQAVRPSDRNVPGRRATDGRLLHRQPGHRAHDAAGGDAPRRGRATTRSRSRPRSTGRPRAATGSDTPRCTSTAASASTSTTPSTATSCG